MHAPDYLEPLATAFNQHTNAENASQMKRYMKDKFAYFGIKAPLRKRIIQEHKINYGLIPDGQSNVIVTWCWQQEQREYQYFAMDFLGRVAKKADEKSIDLYVYMILHKSWWDTVDFIASNLVGTYFKLFPAKISSLTDQWMLSGDIWLQRTCLLFQLKYKSKTNTKLLESFINPLISSKEFFIRKAIGWALREYSKTNPDYVINFVETHALSGLSEREALKWIKSKQ